MDRQSGKKKQLEEKSTEDNSSDAFYRQLILAQNAAFAHGAYITQSPFMAPELAVAYSMLDPVYASYSAMMANPWNIAGLCASAATTTSTTTTTAVSSSSSGFLEAYSQISTKKKSSSPKAKILTVPTINDESKRDEATATSGSDQNVSNDKPNKRKRKSSPVRRVKAVSSSKHDDSATLKTNYSSLPSNNKAVKKQSSRPSLSECLAKMTTCVAASGHNLWSGASAVNNTEGVLDLSSKPQESDDCQNSESLETQKTLNISEQTENDSDSLNSGKGEEIQSREQVEIESKNTANGPTEEGNEDNNNDKDDAEKDCQVNDNIEEKLPSCESQTHETVECDKGEKLNLETSLETNDDNYDPEMEEKVKEEEETLLKEDENLSQNNKDIAEVTDNETEKNCTYEEVESESTLIKEKSIELTPVESTIIVDKEKEDTEVCKESSAPKKDMSKKQSNEIVKDISSLEQNYNLETHDKKEQVRESIAAKNCGEGNLILNITEPVIVKKKKKKKKRKHHKHEESNGEEKKASIVLKLPKEKIFKNDPYAFDEDDEHTPTVQPLTRPIHRNGTIHSRRQREELKTSVSESNETLAVSSSSVTTTASHSQCGPNHTKESSLPCYPATTTTTTTTTTTAATTTTNLEEELDDNKLLASINDILTDSERKQQLQNDLKSFSEVLEQLQQQHPPPVTPPNTAPSSSFPYTYSQQPTVTYQSSYKTSNYTNNENSGYYNTYPSGAAPFPSEMNCPRRDAYYGQDTHQNFQYNTSSSYTGAYGTNYNNYPSSVLPQQQIAYQGTSHRMGAGSGAEQGSIQPIRSAYYPQSPGSTSHISQHQQYFHPPNVRNSNSMYNGNQQSLLPQPSTNLRPQGTAVRAKTCLPLPTPPPSTQVYNESKLGTACSLQTSTELSSKVQSTSPISSGTSSTSVSPDKNECSDAPATPVNEESDLVERLRSNTQEEVPSCNCLGSNTVYDERVEGPFYTHLGAAQSIAGIRKLFEERTGLTGNAIRIEKIIYSGKEGKGTQGCPVSKWIIRRSSIEEKVLIIARPRVGHTCPQAVITVNIVVWEGVPSQQADELYDYLRQLLPVYGLQTDRRCGSNEQKTCACQGWKDDVGGASFSFGCSWSMYYNGCKFARSQQPRKFRLKNESHETQLEHALQSLASHLSPIYKQVAPDSFRNQTQFEKDGLDCRLGLDSGRPFSGVTACIDYCSHAHRDNHNMNNGSTVVVTLTKHRGLGKGPDEQLHVHPLCILDPTAEDGTRESRLQQERDGSVNTLTKFEQIVRIRSTPTPCKKKRKLQQQEEKRKRGGDMPKKKAPTKAELEQRMRMAHNLQMQMSSSGTGAQNFQSPSLVTANNPDYNNPYTQMSCGSGIFPQNSDGMDNRRWWNGSKTGDINREDSLRWCEDFNTTEGDQSGHEEISYNEHLFLDENIGGVALALGHGSVLLECAKREMHSTTAIREPNRFHPTRISLVFYQHKNMNYARHGELQYQQKSEMWKKRREQQQQQQQQQANELNACKRNKSQTEQMANSIVRQSAEHCVVQSASHIPRAPISHPPTLMNLHRQQNWNSAPPNAYGFWH
ncbi:unnamed protein product [Dimorphilus gyrociliatus]|uniref:Methylcytosine dioxygenase TET n=1 Tax=Dimorphilus gyrociliatus TaxID=2664684 RepID=A0A7I8W5J6_9ANNE|nr:unnamed protein product [Dimorphilus gyrociliatus]